MQLNRLLILTLLALMALPGMAQRIPGFVKYYSRVQHDGVAADSVMYVPVRDTNFTPSRIGSIVMRPADSAFYVAISIVAPKKWQKLGSTGVTSVGISMPAAFSVSGSPVTGSGTLTVTGAGTAAQYVRGDGQLATFPRKVDSMWRVPGVDSTYFSINGVNYALKDSVGGSTTPNLDQVLAQGGSLTAARTADAGNNNLSFTNLRRLLFSQSAMSANPSGNGANNSSISITAAAGGASSYSTGTVRGGNGGDINVTGGNGGAITGAPSVGTGGRGSNINLTAGDGGLGTTNGGQGGAVEIQAGAGGGGTNGGSAGYVALKGGNAGSTGGAAGGNVYVVGGIPQGTGLPGHIFLGVSPSNVVRGGVTVGSAIAEPSAKLEVASTTSGFLPPRMTTAQMNAISAPVAGLVVYNTDSSSLCLYNGSAWRKLTIGSGGFSYTFTSGLTEAAGEVRLGGSLLQHTSIEGDGTYDLTLNPRQLFVPYQSVTGGQTAVIKSDGRLGYTIDTIAITFGAGSGAAGDTAAFTTSALYGSYLLPADSFFVTEVFAVIRAGSTDTLGIQIYYNDSIDVNGTAIATSTLALTSRPQGHSTTTISNPTIPPRSQIWCKSPTVVDGRKPEYLSVSLIGYRKRRN